MSSLPWIAAFVGSSLLVVLLLGWIWMVRRAARVAPLPTDWALSARPVFSTDERRVYKLIREALPHHVVLSKLPLVRFCQPNDPGKVRFWYDLLGSINVTFAVCSANGRVLAAIDLDIDRGSSRRILQIKQSVLGACRVRYLRCPVDHLPSVAEFQLLVPSGNTATRGSQSPASSGLDEARDSLASTLANRRAQRSAMWQDSSVFQDTFFAPDSRLDGFGNSEFSALSSSALAAVTAARSNGHGEDDREDAARSRPVEDGGGVVVETLSSSTVSRSHH